MNTSEALDLSKENIQPLKQGRHPVKLGTALQAQTNVELHQKLLAEREQFELLIRMYNGDDPLKPHYDYVQWIEQSFPKHGPESNLVQVLENTLTTFKDDEHYKQDSRYAELLIKYIDSQPNPIDIYQLVYNQGLCTMCASFYKAWADELDKHNDFKSADQIYELGIKVRAQPLEYLQEAHLRFQLSVGRRMLGHQQELNEDDAEYNRQALHKLQKKNVYSTRDPTGAPGRYRQQPLGNVNVANQNNAPFKVYQGDDEEYNMHGESNGRMFPKQNVVNKENTLKPGPWSQHGGKHRSRTQTSTTSGPTFQVHEDEGADFENGHHKTSSVPRALKPRKVDNFTCPLAVFEPPDPTKKPMYCKTKVYAGGREFQFEELRAVLYNCHYDRLEAQKILKNAECKADSEMTTENSHKVADSEALDNHNGYDENVKVMASEFSEAVTKEPSSEQNLKSPKISHQVEINSNSDAETSTENKKQPSFEAHSTEKVAFEVRKLHLEANTSLFHSQSLTVNTKEAMDVVQEMWNSPSPAQTFGKNSRTSKVHPSSPVGIDESGVFKIPPVPPPPCKAGDALAPVEASKVSAKNTPSFPIYSDEDPLPAPLQAFNIYTDDGDCEKVQVKRENIITGSENIQSQKQEAPVTLPLQLHNPTMQSSVPVQYKGNMYPPGSDAGTIKMLAFQSDSDDSDVELPKPRKLAIDNIKIPIPIRAPTTSEIQKTASPAVEEMKTDLCAVVPQLTFHEEDRYEDMTCNTKAFEFVLPSSTPLLGHLKTTAQQPAKNCNNGSYIVEDVKKCGTKQDLSMIFEASKERYSSSSGSSGSKTQGSVCTVANTSVQPTQVELLEKLAQISSKSNEELEKSIGLLQISEPVDPFSSDLISKLLVHIGYPKKHHLIGLHRFETEAPVLHCNSSVTLGGTKYSVVGELGKGNYARVLKATRDGHPVALKQQRPAWEWEWYIVQELQSRLPPNMMGNYLHMDKGYIYKNASILESEWAQYGSVLSVINKLKIKGKGHDLLLAMYFSIQFVSIIEHLHKCKIIHGDIKPDNFVLCSLLSAKLSEPCVKLIDFGRSIDMALLPEGTTFNTVVTTDGFQCNEMKEGRPWTYQTDLYGLAGSIYCVLFYDYMKVVKKGDKWQIITKIPRYMKPALWQDVFACLLNVESCEKLPDLTLLRETLEAEYKAADGSRIIQSINVLNNILLNK